MRILLDEQLRRQLVPFLIGHEVRTVQQESWAGLKNGALLTAAEDADFAILLTGDQNLQFQQNLASKDWESLCCAPPATQLKICCRSSRPL